MPRRVLILFLAIWAFFPARAALPEGTLRYEVRYKWGVVDTRVANAVFTHSRKEWDGQPALHAQVSLRATPFFRLFMAEEYWMEAYLSTDGKQPFYSHAPLKNKGVLYNFDTTYHYDTRKVESTTVSVEENLSRTFSMDDESLDIFVVFYYLQTLDASSLPENGSHSIQIIMPRSVAPALVSFEGLDTEMVPGTPCNRYLVQLTGRGLMENKSGNTVHVWVTADANRQLRVLSVPLNNGTMIARLK